MLLLLLFLQRSCWPCTRARQGQGTRQGQGLSRRAAFGATTCSMQLGAWVAATVLAGWLAAVVLCLWGTLHGNCSSISSSSGVAEAQQLQLQHQAQVVWCGEGSSC
jgi:hypothetical protein